MNAPITEFGGLSDLDRVPDTLKSVRREHIIKVLRETSGIVSGPNGAATRLGLKRTTLQSIMQRLAITPKDYQD